MRPDLAPRGTEPTTLRMAHTAQLDETERHSIRALLDVAFGGLPDTDWEHGLGGMHALVLDGTEPVAHGSVVQRRLLHGGRALRTGYVEVVGVHPDRRGEGHAATVMAVLEQIITRGYDLGALSATEMAMGFYTARGWRIWRGPSGVVTPDGVRATPDDDGAIHVFPTATELDLDGELLCDWRDGDVW